MLSRHLPQPSPKIDRKQLAASSTTATYPSSIALAVCYIVYTFLHPLPPSTQLRSTFTDLHLGRRTSRWVFSVWGCRTARAGPRWVREARVRWVASFRRRNLFEHLTERSHPPLCDESEFLGVEPKFRPSCRHTTLSRATPVAFPSHDRVRSEFGAEDGQVLLKTLAASVNKTHSLSASLADITAPQAWTHKKPTKTNTVDPFQQIIFGSKLSSKWKHQNAFRKLSRIRNQLLNLHGVGAWGAMHARPPAAAAFGGGGPVAAVAVRVAWRHVR